MKKLSKKGERHLYQYTCLTSRAVLSRLYVIPSRELLLARQSNEQQGKREVYQGSQEETNP